MVIRRATATDVKELSKLAATVWKASFGGDSDPIEIATQIEKHRSETYFHRVIDSHLILLAITSDKIVGFIEIGQVSLPVEDISSSDRELIKLYVDIPFQRNGIGSQLIDAAFSHPELGTVSNIYLDVWEKNAAALKLYQRYGFKIIGEHYPPFGSSPDLIMVRKLFDSRNAS